MPQALPFELPDLGRAMAAAQQLRAGQLAIEERERALDRHGKKAAAVKAYLAGGDPTELMLIDPKLLGHLEQRRAAAGQAQRDIGVRRAQQAAGLAKALRVNPAAYESARGALLQTGDWTPEELPSAPGLDPQSAGELASQLEAIGSTVGGVAPAQEQGINLVDATEKAAFRNYRAANPLASPRQAMSDPAWPQYVEAAKKEIMTGRKAAAPKISVSTGSMALDKPTTTEQQKEITKSVDMLAALARAEGQAKKELFTGPSRIRTKISGAVAWWDPDWVPGGATEELKAKRGLNQELMRLTLVFRKWATGVAGGPAEMKKIESQMPNLDMSWPEFQASTQQLKEELTTKIRLAQRFLSERGGLPMNEAELETAIAQAVLSGDTGKTPEDMSRTLDELEAKKLDDNEIARRMTAGGYWDKQQAAGWLRMRRGNAGQR